ncbi:MAG: rhodanese-like domain-containing protein [Luteolibacter sp.]
MKNFSGYMFLLGFGGMVSCASDPSPAPEVVAVKPEVEVQPKAEKKTELQSKPVEIPRGSVKKGKVTGMGVDELFPLQQTGEVLLYDVRDHYFYGIDHIPGSVNWPSKQYEEQVQRRDLEIEAAQAEGKKVVFYCTNLGCPEARKIAAKVKQRGYDIYVLTMGIDSWRKAELPLE